MSNYISFRPQDAQLPTYIRFVITQKAFDKINPNSQGTLDWLTRFSQNRVFLMVKIKGKGRNDEHLEVFTPDGTLVCVESEGSLLVTGFGKNTLIKQSIAMKYGVCFQVSQGIIIQIKLKGYQMFFDIVNGKRYTDNAFASQDVYPSVRLIQEKTTQTDEQAEKEEPVVEEEYQPERKLANLLQMAESYSILASELEERKANMQGNVAYTGIEAAEYDRTDRVAYRFRVDGLDEKIFKLKTQVEVEDKDQVCHAAKIIELVKAGRKEPVTAVTLLFNEQISISQFYEEGWFRLSFSTVNKDVQLAANERIRTGEAAAKYMDAVLGRNVPAGFDRKDLSEVKAKLQQKKYPPNQSQMDAICAGINTRDVFLVMGPPGTGKTTVILEWVKYFVTKEHKRVLVSSQNNKAVDNVLARIADEEDIDIIRVGSEEKLQSDVLPYMFENKVAALRQSIVGKSQEKHLVIDRITEQWQQYAAQLDQIAAMYGHLEQQRQAFAAVVRQRLLPLYQQLTNQLRQFRQLQQEKQTAILKIKTLNRRIQRHETAKNFFIRFLTGLFYKYNLKKIRQWAQQYTYLKKDEQRAIEKYGAARARYREEYEQIKHADFLTYVTQTQQTQEAIRQQSQKPACSDEDIWGLFSRCEAFSLQTPADCDTLKQMIEQDMQKARQLQGILSQWKEDMASKQNYALNDIIMESVDLVGATCVGINSQKRFANLEFDVTIIDEAGQIQVHNALVPMSVSNKLIMLGDHKQIPPNADPDLVALCEENGVKHELLEKSLFEKMYNELPASNKLMLDTQYRMPAEIADTISEWFYEGKYYSPPFKRGLGSLIPKLSASAYVVIDTSGERGRFEHKIKGAGCDNSMEAGIVADILRHLARDPDNDLKEVGVISAYASQVALIQDRLRDFLPEKLVSEMVASLDSFQGQERDIILYSFAKSSNMDPHSQRIGFLNELRRLNVAMTRCKKMLILIGDMEFLSGCQYCEPDEFGEACYDKSELQFSDFIKKMLSDVRGGSGELIPYRQFAARMKGGDV